LAGFPFTIKLSVLKLLTEAETERMIKLRAANEALFTGRKHSAKPAWRAILFELGLQGRLTTEQLAKKWDNLKRRYKELKFPSRGVEANPNSWPWFYRMNDAMEGRLANAAPILAPIVEDGGSQSSPTNVRDRKQEGVVVLLLCDEFSQINVPSPPQIHKKPHKVSKELLTQTSSSLLLKSYFIKFMKLRQKLQEPCGGSLGGLEREWEAVERERAVLDREREMVERDRATVQVERLWLDRERAAVEQDRALVEQERAALVRDREALNQRALMMNPVGHLNS
uniref:Myb/SANT-like DNA-binding domain-containing protein n=1 Tax=Poecilia formosa TaxID=48698 RepID=A0A087Y2I7_POEFO